MARTLILARRALTKLKIALAGATFETSLATFKASIALFNEERRLPRTSSLWDFVDILQARGGCKKAVRHGGPKLSDTAILP